MSKKSAKLLSTIVCFLIVLSSFSQQSIIKWTPDTQLTWDDFNEKKGSKLAYSAVAIKLKPIISTTKRIKLEVYAYFDKSMSRTGIYDAKVLEHEQFHFLIGELFARKLRKKILYYGKAKFFKDRNEFNRIYKANYTEYLAYQKLYDKETVHSVDQEAQKRWEEKIWQELKEYAQFSNKIIEFNR
jgi:hypothetical protein